MYAYNIYCTYIPSLHIIYTYIYKEPYQPLYIGGQPAAADKEVQEHLRGHVMRTTGIEVGNILGDLKVLAAHSFLHLLLAICGDQVKYAYI